MTNVVTIGEVPFSRQSMLEKLEEFSALYEQRPIKNNTGGMLSPHAFLAWFALSELKPKAIVESGVWLGQGTWLFEQACPDAKLYCIDLNLNRVRYRSKRAEYFDRDFATVDWTGLPKEETVLFFDDHQDAYERVKLVKWCGFKHILFEDNYPPRHGDCYSLKQAFAHSGLRFSPAYSTSLKRKYKHAKRRLLSALGRMREVPPNDVDAKYLRQNLAVYYELPPVLKGDRTRFGVPWDDENYPTNEPLLQQVESDFQRKFKEDAATYTCLCYVQLK